MSLTSFLAHVADITSQIHDRWTPLHIASRDGIEDDARLLLERGIDVAAQINDGSTPIHIAAQSGFKEVACLLLEHGADVTGSNR